MIQRHAVVQELRHDIREVDDLRGARLLRGVRGRAPVDRAAIVAMLVALGRLGFDRPDVLEVDLNPVIATAGGAIAVDALVVLEGPRL